MARFVPMRWITGAVAAAVFALLSSCGGGGSSGPPPVAITAASPPAGATGVAYPGYTLMASGGSQSFNWTESGPLPPGLTLSTSGQLTGTPVTAGSYPIVVTVSDSSQPAQTAQMPVTLVINASPPVIANSDAPTGMVGVVYAPFQFSTNWGLAPFVWMETGALDGLALSSSGVLSGTPSAVGKFPITLKVTDAQKRTAPSISLIVRVSLARSGTFTLTTGSLTVPRSGHTATLLNTGTVLVTGGANGAADPSAELYDPKTGMFTVTGSMTEARVGHTATLLHVAAAANFGKVLIVGPMGSTAELYDPAAGTFTATGSMTQARTSPTATLLETGSAKVGSVLIVGGNGLQGDLTAELYDPATGIFSATGSTNILRTGHTATQLLDGRVLIAGGGTETAELYDPTSGTFTPTGSMTIARTGATATRLQDGSVLIFGAGESAADLYDANTGRFASVESYLTVSVGSYLAVHGQTASLRQDGSVLTVGGYILGPHRPNTSVYAAALFGPESGGFAGTGSLNTSRGSHTATVLPDGTVLIVGGTERTCGAYGSCAFGATTTIISSAELFK